MVALVAGILSNLRTPAYRATARVLLTPNDPTQQLNPTTGANGSTGTDADRYVTGQISIAESEGVAYEAVKSLQGVTVKTLEAKVSVSQSGQSNVLNVSASDPDPTQARNMANAVAKGYIENRRKAAVSGLQGAADDIQSRLGPLQSQIAQYDAQIGDGSTLPGASTTPVSPVNPNSAQSPTQPASQVPPATSGLGGAPTTDEAIKAARYAAAVQYETLYSRQQELLVDISLKRGDAELIAEAKTPTAPVSPKPKRDAALGAFLGLLLGIGISVLREQLNDTVRSAEEVERMTTLPLLAQLPLDDQTDGGGVALDQRPGSPLSEAVRALRTSVQYLGVDNPVKVIVVTSALPGEGKSLVATNLAAAFAQADYRTVLMSADLRRPSLHSAFGTIGDSPGLVGLITGATPSTGQAPGGNGQGHLVTALDNTVAAALVPTPVRGLLLLPSGPIPPNPAEILGSRKMRITLGQLSASADIVIVDTPPLLPVTDAAVLAPQCDGVILVTALNETRRDAIERAKSILDGTGARVIGVVANKAPMTGSGYYYGSYSGYADQPPPVDGSPLRTSRSPRPALPAESSPPTLTPRASS